jgi:hypothetical protein
MDGFCASGAELGILITKSQQQVYLAQWNVANDWRHACTVTEGELGEVRRWLWNSDHTKSLPSPVVMIVHSSSFRCQDGGSVVL